MAHGEVHPITFLPIPESDLTTATWKPTARKPPVAQTQSDTAPVTAPGPSRARTYEKDTIKDAVRAEFKSIGQDYHSSDEETSDAKRQKVLAA